MGRCRPVFVRRPASFSFDRCRRTSSFVMYEWYTNRTRFRTFNHIHYLLQIPKTKRACHLHFVSNRLFILLFYVTFHPHPAEKYTLSPTRFSGTSVSPGSARSCRGGYGYALGRCGRRRGCLFPRSSDTAHWP